MNVIRVTVVLILAHFISPDLMGSFSKSPKCVDPHFGWVVPLICRLSISTDFVSYRSLNLFLFFIITHVSLNHLIRMKKYFNGKGRYLIHFKLKLWLIQILMT